jgi:predicted DNA-binding ribbon-helix-helix protein
MKKRSIVIDGRKTSISLEDSFWSSLQNIARERATTIPKLISALDATRNENNLSSAIRVFVLNHYRNNVAGANGAQRAANAAQEHAPMAIGITRA